MRSSPLFTRAVAEEDFLLLGQTCHDFSTSLYLYKMLSELVASHVVNLYMSRLSDAHELGTRQHVLLTARYNDLALRLRARRKVRLLPAKCGSANSKSSSRGMARFLRTEEAGLPAELLGYGLV